MVESLMYLMIGSCPDIGFAIVKLAQQMANSSNGHYQAGLHLCRYLLNTYKYQIVYDGLSIWWICMYVCGDGQGAEGAYTEVVWKSSRSIGRRSVV